MCVHAHPSCDRLDVWWVVRFQLKLVYGCGHSVQEDQPNETAGSIISFAVRCAFILIYRVERAFESSMFGVNGVPPHQILYIHSYFICSWRKWIPTAVLYPESVSFFLLTKTPSGIAPIKKKKLDLGRRPNEKKSGVEKKNPV